MLRAVMGDVRLVECRVSVASEVFVGFVPEPTVVCRELMYRILEMRYTCCFRTDSFTAAEDTRGAGTRSVK